jgi:hypothetical protein
MATLLAVGTLSAAGPAPACCPDGGASGARCAFDYIMRLGSSLVARLRLEIDHEGGDRSIGRLEFRPAGFATWLGGGNRARMEAEVVVLGGQPRPDRFHVRYDKPDRYRDIRIRYDPATGEIAELRYDDDGRPRESEVPPSLRTGTVDPVTAFFLLQRWVADPARRPGDRITVPVFEGRKRLDMLVDMPELPPPDAPVRHLRARLVGLYGFEDGYGFVEGTANAGRPVWLDVTVTRGLCPVPLRVRGAAGALEPSIVLERRLRRPRKRRFPSRAAAPGVRRSRTSRARCRTRRRARP